MRSYLRGDTLPDLGVLEEIAETGGVSLSWLTTGKEPEVAQSPVNSSLLKDVVAALADVFEELDLDPNPDEWAELVSLVYEMYAETEKPVNRAIVLRLVKK